MTSLGRIGKYELLKSLALGGMAEIFLARQTGMEGFEKVVVIKKILPHLGSQDRFVQMFLDEARLAARFNHPNVVQIYDLGHEADAFYIAMAVTIVGGLAVATVLTMVVVPVFYAIFFKAKKGDDGGTATAAA